MSRIRDDDRLGSSTSTAKAHFIRRRGENVSAWELQRLIEEQPGRCRGVCLGRAFPRRDAVGTWVVCMPWCAHRMAAFIVPRFIEARDTMPHMSVGKLDNEALKGTGEGGLGDGWGCFGSVGGVGVAVSARTMLSSK